MERIAYVEKLVNDLEQQGYAFKRCEDGGGWEIYGQTEVPKTMLDAMEEHADELHQVLSKRLARFPMTLSTRLH